MKEYDYVKARREDVGELKGAKAKFARFTMRTMNKVNVALFRMSKGRLMNKLPGTQFPVCVVTTKGAKSGQIRYVAVLHLPHGENKLLVASQAGLPKNPVWYYNIKAHPDIQIMADGEEKSYRARQVDDEEKASLWPHLVSLYPEFDDYQARTDRNIPVFCCEPSQ